MSVTSCTVLTGSKEDFYYQNWKTNPEFLYMIHFHFKCPGLLMELIGGEKDKNCLDWWSEFVQKNPEMNQATVFIFWSISEGVNTSVLLSLAPKSISFILLMSSLSSWPISPVLEAFQREERKPGRSAPLPHVAGWPHVMVRPLHTWFLL